MGCPEPLPRFFVSLWSDKNDSLRTNFAALLNLLWRFLRFDLECLGQSSAEMLGFMDERAAAHRITFHKMGVRIVITIGAMLLVAVCYLLLSGTAVLPFAGVLLALLPYGLWRLREAEPSRIWELYVPASVAFAGIALVSTARWFILTSLAPPATPLQRSPSDLLIQDVIALLLSLATSGVVILLKRRRVEDQCHRCQKPMGKDRAHCPRGGQHWVCARCWLAERFRCKDCEEFRTPLLTLENEEWWTARLGDRSRSGQCHLCRRSAIERDLRKCGRCTGAMCIRCWDMENGRCAKCAWVMPGLPEPLARFNAEFEDFDDELAG